jgi:redox-regulated HSP33 family molecular chaperone
LGGVKVKETLHQDTISVKFNGKERIKNETTGEIMDVMRVKEASTQDNFFMKVWKLNMMKALEKIGNKKIDVLNYILENMDHENKIIATQQEIADKVGCSRQTVSTVVGQLRESGYIMTETREIQISPDIIFKGGHDQRMNVLIEYEQRKKEKADK